jgi:hypothetical protein
MDKNNPKKRIIDAIDPKYPSGTFQIPMKTKPFQLPHIRIREFLIDVFNSWRADFYDRIPRTTNYAEFIDMEFSPLAKHFNEDGHITYLDLCGNSTYLYDGYRDAVRGNDPYVDEIIDDANKLAAKGIIDHELYNYLTGYFTALWDHFVETYHSERNRGVSKSARLFKSTVLLKKYYENGCQEVTKTQVIALSVESGFTFSTLESHWKKLHANNYTWIVDPRNIRWFQTFYDQLLEVFQDTNQTAFALVQKDYNRLKREHPKYLK